MLNDFFPAADQPRGSGSFLLLRAAACESGLRAVHGGETRLLTAAGLRDPLPRLRSQVGLTPLCPTLPASSASLQNHAPVPNPGEKNPTGLRFEVSNLFLLASRQVAVCHGERGHRLRRVSEGQEGGVAEGGADAGSGAQPALQRPPGARGRLADLRTAGSV